MPEKLYKLEQIIEFFDEESPIPERSLIFTGPDYPHKVTFPKDRTTLFFQGELYDWYGKKIKITDDIKEIIAPFGYEQKDGHIYETYLVRKTNNKLAIADLSVTEYDYCDPKIPLPICMKSQIVGDFLSNNRELKCRTWSFESLLDCPIENTCFKVLEDHREFKILIGIGNDNNSSSPKEMPCIFFYPTIGSPTQPIYHIVLKNRKAILEIPVVDLHHLNPWNRKSYPCNRISYSSDFISGNLSFFNDGNKVTAYGPKDENGKRKRISTDIEVLLHIKNTPYIIWYYDPEP